jgi:hypothetical protein
MADLAGNKPSWHFGYLRSKRLHGLQLQAGAGGSSGAEIFSGAGVTSGQNPVVSPRS